MYVALGMDQLRRVLSEVAGGGSLLSLQPGGNYGDDLIYRGFDKLIEGTDVEKVPFAAGHNRSDRPPDLPSANLRTNYEWLATHVTFLRHRLASSISAVYIHGGGNFNDLWTGGIRAFTAADRYFECPIVVGPQSCLFERTDPTALFEGVDSETHFFCREMYSYEIVEEATAHLDHVSVYHSRDTALYLERSDLPVAPRSGEYTLLAMRADKESAEPEIDHDVEGPLIVRDVSIMADDFAGWVGAVAGAEVVYTDRLHVAILASILEKPLVWYEASYHKSRGVYEYSLSDRENVEFHRLW